MNRIRRDIDDLDDSLFDRDEAQRRRQERAEAIERGKTAEVALAEYDAAARARVRADILRANDEFIAREYQSAGVEPPIVSGDGKPAVSLSMLLRLDWEIQDVAGVRTLVAPPRRNANAQRG